MAKSNEKTIEIEYRSVFDENTYNRLKAFLDTHAKNLGKDDKDVFFFIFPDKLLKVVNNVSKKTAKIVLKLNKIGKGSDFEEIEIPIQQEDVKKAVRVFTLLSFTELQNSFQKRQNYLYKGVELALKYSNTWGFHLELEIMVEDKKEVTEVKEKISSVAKELQVSLMTEAELAEFTGKIDKGYKIGKYAKR